MGRRLDAFFARMVGLHGYQPTDNARDLRLDLARAVGLPTENLVSFTLTVSPAKLPLVEASYLLRTANGLEKVIRRHTITPLGDVVGHVPPRPIPSAPPRRP